MAVKKGTLSIDSENIFPIIKKWVYSDHDIFVREMISNGCDAITKLKKLDMMGEYELPENYKAKIEVIVNPEEKTMKFIDNGLGMTADEVEEYITQIAFSGATQFLEKYKDKTTEDDMIGHFGLGFYSAFMVADEVQIDTLSYKEGAAPVHWASQGGTEDNVVVDITLAHDQSLLAVGYMNGTVALYEPKSLEMITNGPFKIYNKSLLGLALSPDDNSLATAGQESTASLWSLKGTEPKMKQTFSGHTDLVITVCFSPDDTMVLSGSKDESLRAWSAKTGQCMFNIKAHTNTLFKVKHHPTENCFISCAGDGRVCVWEYNPIWK